jgi:hypothetical protein
MSLKTIRSTSFVTALVVAALLSGCGSSGIGDIFGGNTGNTPSDNRNDPYGNSSADVQGTVERVDTVARRIVVDSEGTGYRSDLRNSGDEVVLYYDDRTTVEYQGQTYRPQDLEPGDRIRANVDQSGDRLMVAQIQVLQDVSSGSDSTWNDDRYDDRATDELRGTVRYVDTRNRTLEIEPSRTSSFSTSRSSDVVVVYYDAQTLVEFEGRQYKPENLERGDVVEIEIRDNGGRLLAEQILVTGEGAATR